MGGAKCQGSPSAPFSESFCCPLERSRTVGTGLPQGNGGRKIGEVRRARGGAGELKIRPALEADLSAIARIEAESYSNPWHPDTFGTLLRRNRAKILVAEDGEGGVAGYGVYWWVLEQAELANLAVQADQRGRGVGGAILDRTLLVAADQGIESIFLEVRVSNESARRLYASRGFRQISVRKGYYQNPKEDALILVRSLGTGAEESGEVGDGPFGSIRM